MVQDSEMVTVSVRSEIMIASVEYRRWHKPIRNIYPVILRNTGHQSNKSIVMLQIKTVNTNGTVVRGLS